MKVEVKKLERGKAELIVELTVEEYKPFLEEAAKAISKEIKIKGFREGKAPLAEVEKHVGKGQLWQEALEPAVRTTFGKAVEQEKLMTVGSPEIDIVKLAPDNPVSYKAIVGLLPEVTLGDLSKVKVKAEPVVVKEEEVKKAIDDLLKMRSTEKLVDKKAEKGDKVEIDFETFLDKAPIENGKYEKFSLVLGEGTFIPGFEDNLMGVKKDDKKEFKLEFPKNYHQKNLAGRLVDFKVKVLAIYEVEVPKLTDEFAKSLGDIKDAKELENKIKENIKLQEEQKANQKTEEELIDKVIEASKFGDIPDVLVNSEARKMMDEMEHNLSHQGMKLDDYLSHMKKTREEIILDFAPQAMRRIKSALVVREVAKQNKIEATKEEVEAEVKSMLQTYAENPEAEKQINTPDYKAYLGNIIAARKTMAFLKEKTIEK